MNKAKCKTCHFIMSAIVMMADATRIIANGFMDEYGKRDCCSDSVAEALEQLIDAINEEVWHIQSDSDSPNADQ